jgi:hypothetical protein
VVQQLMVVLVKLLMPFVHVARGGVARCSWKHKMIDGNQYHGSTFTSIARNIWHVPCHDHENDMQEGIMLVSVTTGNLAM